MLLKNSLFFKVSLYDSLLFRWNQAEFSGAQGDRTGKRRSTISFKNMREKSVKEGISTIPVDVKLYFIRTRIKEMMSVYMHEYRIYKAEFNSIRRQNLKNRWALDKSVLKDYPIPPEKPNLYESFTPDIFYRLIQTALAKRLDWNKLIEYQQLGAFETKS